MCHWESSRRSLYVKTVWTNGHHHAILTPEDPLLKTAQKLEQRKSFSVISRHRSAKTVPTLLPTSLPRKCGEGDLSVSSVQIFLEGLQKGRSRSKRQSAVSMYQIRERERDKFVMPSKAAPTIAVIPMDRLKMKNINDEIEFFRNDRQKSRRSNSYDVGMSSNAAKEDKSWMEPYVSRLSHSGQNTGTVLSERVMLWLDLARQSQEGRIQKFEEDKAREEIERKQSKKSLTTSPDWFPYVDYDKSVDCSMQETVANEVNATNCKSNRDDLHLNDLSILKSSPMKLTQSVVIPETVSEAQRKAEKASEGKRNDNVPVISSKLENSDDVVSAPSEKERSEGVFPIKYSGSTFSKRQLHIFMPNVPKKKVEIEGRSILSDISSRYSTKVKFTV